MLLLGKSVLCTYAIYVDGRGTYALGKRELSQVRSEGRAAELSFPPPPFQHCHQSFWPRLLVLFL